MMIVRLPRGAQWLIANRIITRTARAVIVRRAPAATDRAPSIKVETKLNTARAKTLRPIEWPARFEIVPLDAYPHLLEAAVELMQTVAHIGPCGLRWEFAFHRRHFRVQTGECKTERCLLTQPWDVILTGQE